MRPVVLVHGAWHGPWCWERVTPLLDAAGVPWVAPDLPSVARSSEGVGVAEDVAAVEAVLDELPGSEPAVLLGHSRGGRVISEAGTHDRVGHLVYLAAFLVDEGEDTAELSRPVAPILRRAADGTSLPDPSRAPAVFYNDCTPEDVAWALSQVRPNSAGTPPEPRSAWRSKPSTYVVCALDQAILAVHQRRMAQRATSMVEWQTGHSPFISRPELVAELLIRLAA
jgi:pimeloyl-ACP methyl ester carboxylesterase